MTYYMYGRSRTYEYPNIDPGEWAPDCPAKYIKPSFPQTKHLREKTEENTHASNWEPTHMGRKNARDPRRVV